MLYGVSINPCENLSSLLAPTLSLLRFTDIGLSQKALAFLHRCRFSIPAILRCRCTLFLLGP